jgi:hypothetical protein
VAELCSGVGAACPADRVAPGGQLCTPLAPPAACDGVPNVGALSGVCGDGGACIAALPAACTCQSDDDCNDGNACSIDRCTAGECVHDEPAPGGTVCRAASGACDVAERCTGQSVQCPADAREASGVVCRQAAGNCDVVEVCDGQSSLCPADRLRSSSYECRAAVGACDVAEQCSGFTPSCPPNAAAPGGTVCREAAPMCDVEETCDGQSFECPYDVREPDGAPCDDASSCTADDRCRAGLCVGALRCECESSADCVERNTACQRFTCDTEAGECRGAFVDEGEACDDAQPCTTNDVCRAGGVCAGERECPKGRVRLATTDGGAVLNATELAALGYAVDPTSIGDDGSMLVECSARGQCCGRTCQCDAGWQGAACATVAFNETTPAPTPAPSAAPDVVDLCADDPNKLAPGDGGCGVGDSDGDGIEDCRDSSLSLQAGWAANLPVYVNDNRLVARLGLPQNAVAAAAAERRRRRNVAQQSSTPPELELTAVALTTASALPDSIERFTLYAYVLNITLTGPKAPPLEANGVQKLAKQAQLCLRRVPPEQTSRYLTLRELCLGFWNSETRQWQCVATDLTTSPDGLMCGRVDHFSVWTVKKNYLFID